MKVGKQFESSSIVPAQHQETDMNQYTNSAKSLLIAMTFVALAFGTDANAKPHPERRGVGISGFAKEDFPVEAKEIAPTKKPPAKIDPRRSLFVTEKDVLAVFTFSDVLEQLAKQSDPNLKLKKEKLFNDWWTNAGTSTDPSTGCGPDATPNNTLVPQLGSDYLCPRAEGLETAPNAFDANSEGGYIPIALVNRYDLASSKKEGALDCGEYRMVFARKSGADKIFKRNFIIFEAVLPNPAPGKVTGCQPIVAKWAMLTSEPDPKKRAESLRDFYFNGIPSAKVAPVISPQHYGNATQNAKGQIRTNQFMSFGSTFDSEWVLREFTFISDGPNSRIAPDRVSANPSVSLFAAGTRLFETKLFQDDFVANSVAKLVKGSINTMGMDIDEKYNAAESRTGNGNPGQSNVDYETVGNNNAPLVARVNNAANKMFANSVFKRAQAMTCAGCHQLSNKADLGDGVTWPASIGFVHTSESALDQTPGLPQSFDISPALKEQFLPFRQCRMEAFLRRDWRKVCK
jgi:hypothetical protein